MRVLFGYFTQTLRRNMPQTYLPTYLPAEVSQWNRSLLEKLVVTQLDKKLLTFYGIRKFITVFTRDRHRSCPHTTPSHPISQRSIPLLSSHQRLGLSIGLFHSGFPTKILYSFLISCVLLATPVSSSLT